MDLKEIRQLLKIVESSNISEIEIEEDDKKLRIIKVHPSNNGGVQYVQQPAPPGAYSTAAPFPVGPAGSPFPAAESPAAPAPEAAKSSNVVEVRSPMVGTFYAAPSPDSDPYVEKGQSVATGQTLCIVEAMKLMNEIECEVSGRIVDILIENSQPVEYNQVLFLVEKS